MVIVEVDMTVPWEAPREEVVMVVPSLMPPPKEGFKMMKYEQPNTKDA